jgi:hypothetical protein
MILVKKKKTCIHQDKNKKYVNKNIYLDGEKFKTTVFSSLKTMPRSPLRLGYFVLHLKFF